MTTYLIRKTKFAAIEWTGSNLTDVQAFVANLPEVDDFYSQFTGVSVTQSSGTLEVTCNEAGSVFIASGGLVVEGCASTSPGLVADMTLHPFYFRVDV